MSNLINGILLAQQKIIFGDSAPHSFQIKQKELLLILWDQLKHVFSPNLDLVDRGKAFAQVFVELLSYPLFKLDAEPISLLNILMGVILLMVGIKYARILSHKSTYELTKITKIDKTSEEILKKVIYYILIVIITVLVLDISHVPITIFTVLGGALAIGIGLGTQNISNDFVSGIIMMIERPFKIGDIIEVEAVVGMVQHIGTRCTLLKNGEGKGIMVPNSALLKNKIINWSYSGEFIKNTAIIRVAYDASIILVTQIIEKALLAHPHIEQKAYIPRAFLVNFDHNALNFEMVFIANLKGPDRREILHQVFARILDDFAKNNVKLASKKSEVSNIKILTQEEDEGEEEDD